MAQVSIDGAADLQALFSSMKPELFQEMLENTIEVNGAEMLLVEKIAVIDNDIARFSYQIRLTKPI
jgi:hypothetical protein